jgi:hypothetical protein
MGGFFDKLMGRGTNQPEDHANKQTRLAWPRNDVQAQVDKQQQQQERVCHDPYCTWHITITDLINLQRRLAGVLARIRGEIEKWVGIYDAHVAGAENIRVFDWRENDAIYKKILADLKHDLHLALDHAERLRAKYDQLKAQGDYLFGSGQPSAGRPACDSPHAVSPWNL